ncbi:FHA domain-containing protein [Candidatus Uabimicrobium amorphum]|uniref:Phosphopeptide-binding protein n=1 Tax=Uabimicrobium amorphum TaxID=2596890 RepID=A0A5S9F2Y2_UABAM|nr:FHA domain-containing protein [Candidatus Uabimicrobium amorphum]BBM82959.1 phosphopeptide-binding protein [Candidatus Uabimicrobium amorphum]
MTNAQLIILEGMQHQLNQVFLLPYGQMRLVGRSSICHFRVDDPLCSSLHFMITSEKNSFYVTDLLSANGVFVDNELIEHCELQPQQKIKIGRMLLEFSFHEEEEDDKDYLTGEEPALLQPLREDSSAVSANNDPKIIPLGRKIKVTKELSILRLAIRHKLISHQHITQLLAAGQSIIPGLIQENLISQEKIDELLREHRYNKILHKDTVLGKLAIYYDFVSDKEIEECLLLQKNKYEQHKKIPRLSEMMVEKKYISVQQNNKLVKILAQQRYG